MRGNHRLRHFWQESWHRLEAVLVEIRIRFASRPQNKIAAETAQGMDLSGKMAHDGLKNETHRQLDLARGSHVYVLAYRRTQQAIVGSRRHRREGLAGLQTRGP